MTFDLGWSLRDLFKVTHKIWKSHWPSRIPVIDWVAWGGHASNSWSSGFSISMCFLFLQINMWVNCKCCTLSLDVLFDMVMWFSSVPFFYQSVLISFCVSQCLQVFAFFFQCVCKWACIVYLWVLLLVFFSIYCLQLWPLANNIWH